MEASAVERERAQIRPSVPEQRLDSGRLIPLLFLAGVLAMYLMSGYAIYALIAALV